MERDIQFHTEDVDRLKAELDHVAEFFSDLGYVQCEVFFGWAWSTDRDKSDLAMKSVNVSLPDVCAEVRNAEDEGLGRLGGDDVWISFDGYPLRIQFCHHEGVHLQYFEPDEVTQHFLDRWRADGLAPMIFEKQDGGSDWRPSLAEQS